MPHSHGDMPDTYYEPYFHGVDDNGDGTWSLEIAVVNYNSDDDERVSGNYFQVTVDYDPYDPVNADRLEQELQELADQAMALYPEGN